MIPNEKEPLTHVLLGTGFYKPSTLIGKKISVDLESSKLQIRYTHTLQSVTVTHDKEDNMLQVLLFLEATGAPWDVDMMVIVWFDRLSGHRKGVVRDVSDSVDVKIDGEVPQLRKLTVYEDDGTMTFSLADFVEAVR